MSSVEYTLLASVFYQRQQGGARRRFRTGDTVTGLSPENAERLLKIGAIAPKSATTAPPPPADPEPEPESDPGPLIDFGEPDDAPPAPARPKSAQSVEVWRAYAVAVGIPVGEAADMTKKQLQEATK